jgi:hypothetical protein
MNAFPPKAEDERPKRHGPRLAREGANMIARTMLVGAALGACLLGGAQPARAACAFLYLDEGVFPDDEVHFRGLSMPSPGKCKPLNGDYAPFSRPSKDLASGTICRTGDGSIRMTYTAIPGIPANPEITSFVTVSAGPPDADGFFDGFFTERTINFNSFTKTMKVGSARGRNRCVPALDVLE